VGEIPSHEYQNLFQQEAYNPQAWQHEALCCSSNLQSVHHDHLTASCLTDSLLQTGEFLTIFVALKVASSFAPSHGSIFSVFFSLSHLRVTFNALQFEILKVLLLIQHYQLISHVNWEKYFPRPVCHIFPKRLLILLSHSHLLLYVPKENGMPIRNPMKMD